MDPTRLAAVGYLNTAPLIEGLDEVAGLSLERTVPSRIAGLVASGDADIGLVSLADAATDPGLAILDCGMIGCDGPTLTVRLFSAVPAAEITRIHADTDSKTSIVLAQLLLERTHGVRPEVVHFDAREQVPATGAGSPDEAWPETLLLIGDKVVRNSPPAVRYPHQIDLGEAWHELTGLPFVYAAWACRTAEADSTKIQSAVALIDHQRRRNLARLDWLTTKHAATHGWPGDLARRYLGSLLKFDLDDRARAAADRFVREAVELKLLPKQSANRWSGAVQATSM